MTGRRASTGYCGELPLFIDDDELRQRLNPKMGRDRFRSIIRVLEARGFPRTNVLFRGRYWPAVRAWLDERNGVGNDAIPAGEDGPECFDGETQREPRTKVARPTTVLGGAPSGARPEGLPGPERAPPAGRG